ncbi:MAG: Gfo/Idh/MocA family oxidoreductase, partial [Planktomarina sp.]
MAKSVSYGIIGCGMMGQEHLRNIALLPDTHVRAIFEPDADMAREAMVLTPEASLVGSIEELLKIEELD